MMMFVVPSAVQMVVPIVPSVVLIVAVAVAMISFPAGVKLTLSIVPMIMFVVQMVVPAKCGVNSPRAMQWLPSTTTP